MLNILITDDHAIIRRGLKQIMVETWGNEVAVAVSLALLASCPIATIVALTLPWLFQRAGIDPAFGSGPLATVVQDLLSIVVYFALAVPLAA